MAKSKSKPRPTVAALERSPSHLLHRALQLALDLYAAEFGGAGLTQRQFAVLAAVADHEGATQTDLVRLTGIDRSTLADMAARMIAKGLLERQRSLSDARANAVSLTEAGRHWPGGKLRLALVRGSRQRQAVYSKGAAANNWRV